MKLKINIRSCSIYKDNHQEYQCLKLDIIENDVNNKYTYANNTLIVLDPSVESSYHDNTFTLGKPGVFFLEYPKHEFIKMLKHINNYAS